MKDTALIEQLRQCADGKTVVCIPLDEDKTARISYVVGGMYPWMVETHSKQRGWIDGTFWTSIEEVVRVLRPKK